MDAREEKGEGSRSIGIPREKYLRRWGGSESREALFGWTLFFFFSSLLLTHFR